MCGLNYVVQCMQKSVPRSGDKVTVSTERLRQKVSYAIVPDKQEEETPFICFHHENMPM